MTPYAALEVIETHSRRDGRRWWVRDDEESHLFNLVEYVDRRLVCWCPDGEARAESPDTERECVHMRAVIDAGMAQRQSSRPQGVIDADRFVS
jgi:hypothetical protein